MRAGKNRDNYIESPDISRQEFLGDPEHSRSYAFVMGEEPVDSAKTIKQRKKFMSRLFAVSKQCVNEAASKTKSTSTNVFVGFGNDDTTVGDTVATGTTTSSDDNTTFTKAVRELRDLPPVKYLVRLSKKTPFACGACAAMDDDGKTIDNHPQHTYRLRDEADRLQYALFGDPKRASKSHHYNYSNFFRGDESLYSMDDTFDNSTLESYGPYRDYLSYDTETLHSRDYYPAGYETEAYDSDVYGSQSYGEGTEGTFDGYDTNEDTATYHTTTDMEPESGFEVTTFPATASEF